MVLGAMQTISVFPKCYLKLNRCYVKCLKALLAKFNTTTWWSLFKPVVEKWRFCKNSPAFSVGQKLSFSKHQTRKSEESQKYKVFQNQEDWARFEEQGVSLLHRGLLLIGIRLSFL